MQTADCSDWRAESVRCVETEQVLPSVEQSRDEIEDEKEEQQNDKLIERVASIAPQFEEMLHSLKGTKYVADIRNYGLAGALTIESAPGEPALRPYQIAMKCWELS